MTHKNIYRTAIAVICMVSMLLVPDVHTNVYAASGYDYVLLTHYSKTMKIGDEFYLAAVASSGKKPKFTSSNSKVASVNTYGKITARKAGTATITAKTANGEAGCKVTVEKTVITLNQKNISLENGYTARLTARVSTGHPVTYRSSKTSVAAVDEDGVVTAKKPGEAVITVTADQTSVTCKVTVKTPKVSLNRTAVSMYRKKTVKLSVQSTSKSIPKWKTNKKSVAVVDSDGTVTAVKNGCAIITVTVDGVSKTCEITVKKPVIRFDEPEVTLVVNQTKQIGLTVSSGICPTFTSSNDNVAAVDERGVIRAKSAGRAYIYAREDGTRERMTVIVQPAK